MTTAIICLIVTLFSPANASEQLHLEYKTFYSHLRQLDNEQLSTLQFAFGFKHVTQASLCTVEKVYIHTDKQDIPVAVDNRNRFVLPTEKALKLAQAEVFIDLAEAANQCDLSVQLEVAPEAIPELISAADLSRYFNAFNRFFDEMGGMLSFLMPSPSGISIQLTDPPRLSNEWDHYRDGEQNKLLISAGQLDTLPSSPIKREIVSYITAHMSR